MASHVFTLLNRVVNDLNVTPVPCRRAAGSLPHPFSFPLSLLSSRRPVRRLINLCSCHRAAEAPVRCVSPLIPPLGRTNGTAPARYARKSVAYSFELSSPIMCGCAPAPTETIHGTSLFQLFP